MKLLTMPGRYVVGTAKAQPNGNEGTPDGVLSRVWATEGALAHAVEHMEHLHAQQPAQAVDDADTEERRRPAFRVVLAPQTAFYRSYTEAMLRRYGALSLESGRVPSLLGREMFRGKVTSYRVHAFDDVVIFVHDIERCIKTLSPEQQRLVLRIGVQEYTYGEAAAMLRMSLRSAKRLYFEAVDELTATFLERRLLERIATDPCQGGEASAKVVSHTPV